MRIDKWLWVARFYKTRSLAAKAVEAHQVRCNERLVKPAHELKVGDELAINAGDSHVVVVVQAMAAQRRPAPEARLLYRETAASVAAREALQEQRRLAPEPGVGLKGRPTKRDGRLLRRWQGE